MADENFRELPHENPGDKPVHVPRESYPAPFYPAVPTPQYQRSYGESDEESIHLMDYWRVLVERRWTIVAAFVTVVTITAIATFKQIPVYRASSTIQIDRENNNVLSFKEIYGIETATDDVLQTQFEVLESRTLARKVVDQLDLEKDPEFMPREGFSLSSYLDPVFDLLSPPAPPSEQEPDTLRPIVDSYLGRLTVTPVRQARLVTVSFESEDPKLAARVINAHGESYIEQNFQFKLDATRDAERFLKTEVDRLKATVEASEDKLQAYSREKRILITEEGQNTATEQLQRLQDTYEKMQQALVEKQSYNDLIQAGNADVLPQVLSNPLIADLSLKLADREKEEARLKVTYGPEWAERRRVLSEIVTIKETIAREKDRIIATAQAEYTAALNREQAYFKALEAQRALVETLNQDFIQYNIMKREADSNKMIYDSLLQRQKEATVSASLRASNIRIIDKAEVPNRPVRPRKQLNLALGSLVGLVLGVGMAFLQEYLDNSVKSPDDIHRHIGLATLGMIPNIQSLEGKSAYKYGYGYGYGHKKPKDLTKSANTPLELVAHSTPSSLMAEAYRSVRTSFMLSSADRAPRLVLITSAAPSEGKTVTAINTAISLTQTGSKVLLVDADMRKPGVHSVFALGNAPGLSSVLAGSIPLKDALHESEVPNLFILPCGIIPPNPGELILSERFNQVLQVLRQYFDYVVIDSPPVANVSDARVIAARADAVILVVKAFATSRHVVKRAAELLMQSRIRNISVVLNDLDVRARTGYYSGYSSGKYYYSSHYGTTPPA